MSEAFTGFIYALNYETLSWYFFQIWKVKI